jgi:hypothetical protein
VDAVTVVLTQIGALSIVIGVTLSIEMTVSTGKQALTGNADSTTVYTTQTGGVLPMTTWGLTDVMRAIPSTMGTRWKNIFVRDAASERLWMVAW